MFLARAVCSTKLQKITEKLQKITSRLIQVAMRVRVV